MSLIPEIESRRARRAIDERPIPREILERVMKAATLAPSCMNSQPWRFLVCENAESLGLAGAQLTPGNYWAKKAPVLIIAFYQPGDDCSFDDSRIYAPFDCGLAVENLLLQATHEGLVAHPMAGFDPAGIKKVFALEDAAMPIALIAIGYPGDESGLSEKHLADEHAPQKRKPLESTVFFNHL